jgi:hypothetical protein
MGSLPPGPAAGAPMLCPSCHAPVPAGSQFCNRCGAAIGRLAAPVAPGVPPPPASPSPPSGPSPVDIRDRVDQDRGMLKRLQLLIPGFRGYRQGEDARAADSFLRLQVADKVHRAVAQIQDLRQTLTQAGQFQGLTDLAPMLADLQQLEGEIRHAEQGYSGISPALRVTPAQIDQLYEYDYGFAQAADQVTAELANVAGAATSGDSAQVNAAVARVRQQVRQLDTAFKARVRAIEGIQI